MIKIYQKQPIQAEQFTKENENELLEKYHMSFDWVTNGSGPNIPVDHQEHKMVYYFEKSNIEYIEIGDWIVTDANGEYWPIADDVFKKTYAELPVIPEAVADWINECIRLGWTRNFLDACYRAPESVDKWIDNNSNMFARAWLDGYQVEAQYDQI